ncbi:hypothetical protein JCM5350_000199 [Sporobolomyces pararoseus]
MEEDPPSYLQTTTSLSTCSPHTTTSSSASPSSCSPSQSQQQQYDHQWRNRLNLPSGMFLLKNVAQGKTLDLLGHKSHEGAPLGVHPIKEPILKGLSLQHSKNNQLFFLDWNDHLYSAAVSRAVDVVDDQLSIALPHPIQMYPSKLSHPLPRFYLDPTTKTLEILFSHDPDFPPPQHPTSTTTSFQEYDYLVETVPLKNKYKNKRRASRIEGLLEKVNGFNPFNQINNNKNNNVTAGGGGGRNDSVVSSNLEKRLPRDRDASLPPPPIPSKHQDASPPSPPPPTLPSRPNLQQSFPPPSNDSIFTSSPSPNTTITDLQARFEERRNSELPSSPGTPSNDNNDEHSVSPTSVPKPQFSSTSTVPSETLLHLRRESLRPTTSSSVDDTNSEAEEEENESEGSESDDEPSGFRPVRVVKILKSSNWRENQYPFHNVDKLHSVGLKNSDDSNKVFPGSEEEEGSNKRRRHANISAMTSEAHPTPPIGLGFDQLDNSDNSNNSRRNSSSHQAEEEDMIEELTAENVWPESIHLRETSFTSNASTVLDPHHHHQQRISSSSSDNPPVSMSRTERRKIRKQELKEIRKWRRRQWEAVSVKIEPVPVDRGSTSSWRVQNDDLDQEFYTFQGVGGVGEEENRYELESEDEEVEEEEVPQPNSIAQVVMTKEKRGSIETAKSVVSGVGSFLTSKLLWSVSTSSTPQQPSHFVREEEEEEEEEEALPPLPLMNEAEQDAEELKSDELEKFGKRNRRKSSLVTTSPPLPELPKLAPITALEVPLPDSIPNTPQVGRAE